MEYIFSLVPVLLFLLLLIFLDSFKLLRSSLLVLCIVWGMAAAGIAYFINSYLLQKNILDISLYTVLISPPIEELLKALLLILIIRLHKIAFVVDGAIAGFAIGAGFALIENIYYIKTFPEAGILLWVVRGLGTAVMHGGAVAVFGIAVLFLQNKYEKFKAWYLLPAYFAAVLIHALFNMNFLPIVVYTILQLIVLPFVLISLFEASERGLRKWLELEFDSEVRLIGMITKGTFSSTKTGQFLLSVRDHFPKEIVFDMLNYIRLFLELSIRAKSNLMLTESGFPPRKDPDTKEKLSELKALEKSIGKTGLKAIAPVLRMSPKTLWKLNQLG